MPDDGRVIEGSKGTYTFHGFKDGYANVSVDGAQKFYAKGSKEYGNVQSDIKYHDESRSVESGDGDNVQVKGAGTQAKPTYNNQGTTEAVVKNALDEDTSVIKKKGE